MSIKLNSNFSIGTAQPLDARNVITKEKMLTINENIWPDVYYAVCTDDGNLYVYNKTNESDPETGKFRIMKSNADCMISESFTPNVTAGSIEAGKEIAAGTTLTDIVKSMLVQSIKPTIKITTADNKTEYFDGEAISTTATVVVDQTNTTVESITSVTVDETDITEALTFTVDSAKTYKVVVTYVDSLTKETATAETSLVISYITPLYYGTSDDNIIEVSFIDTATKLAPTDDMYSVDVTADNKYLVFMTKNELSSIIDYNGFENIDSFVKSKVDDYNVYVSESKVTCTNFLYNLFS